MIVPRLLQYRHYKGAIYTHLYEALHTETQETHTVYMNDKGELFVRPTDMFYGYLEENPAIKRFTLLTD